MPITKVLLLMSVALSWALDASVARAQTIYVDTDDPVMETSTHLDCTDAPS